MKKIREGYKMTELGEIPEKWYISKLSELAQIKRGASPRPINNPKWFSEKKNVGWIRISDVTKTKKYLNSTEQYLSDEGVAKSRLVKPNDLIMSICATVGKPIILNIDACIHDGFILFDDLNNNKIITDYLYYLLQKKEEEFKGMGQTGTQANLNTNIVGSTLIAIPTIEEQKKIASILSTVDEQIDNVDGLIEKNKELKKGLMQQLLTKGIGHTKFKKTEIGEIPEEWEVKQLGDIAQYINGKAFKPSEWDTQGLPIVRIQNLNGVSEYNYYNGQLDEKFIINDGQLLFSWSGSKGTSFGPYIWNNGKAVLNQHIFKVDLKEDVNRIYGYYALKQVTQIIEESAHGSAGLVHVTKGALEKFKIGVPEIEEQKKIASILSKVDEKIEIYENKKEKLEELKKGLMQQLLTGKIRVIK